MEIPAEWWSSKHGGGDEERDLRVEEAGELWTRHFRRHRVRKTDGLFDVPLMRAREATSCYCNGEYPSVEYNCRAASEEAVYKAVSFRRTLTPFGPGSKEIAYVMTGDYRNFQQYYLVGLATKLGLMSRRAAKGIARVTYRANLMLHGQKMLDQEMLASLGRVSRPETHRAYSLGTQVGAYKSLDDTLLVISGLMSKISNPNSLRGT